VDLNRLYICGGTMNATVLLYKLNTQFLSHAYISQNVENKEKWKKEAPGED
jgi:hypothetical protein